MKSSNKQTNFCSFSAEKKPFLSDKCVEQIPAHCSCATKHAGGRTWKIAGGRQMLFVASSTLGLSWISWCCFTEPSG